MAVRSANARSTSLAKHSRNGNSLIEFASIGVYVQITSINRDDNLFHLLFLSKNGSFKKPEDLMQVPRIGQKTFEKNKDLIVVGKTRKKMSKKSK